MTIVGTRPEIIRLSRLIPVLDRDFDHYLVHTGQNYSRELNAIFFENLRVREPDQRLEVRSSSLSNQLSDLFSLGGKLFESVRPDAVLVLGDTNSALLTVLARRLGIPSYHIEAGNRSFDENVPEELNRKVVDHSASFNLAYSEFARSNLLREGLSPRRTFVVGSPMKEVIDHYREQIADSEVLNSLDIQSDKYFLVSAHRQENVDSPQRLETLVDAVNAVANEWEIPVIMSMHPRTRARLSSTSKKLSGLVKLEKPFGFFDFCKLQIESKLVLSDSGSISEEAAVLGFRAVTIRNSMERQEALESALVPMGGIEKEGLLRVVRARLESEVLEGDPAEYYFPNFSNRVNQIIHSTIDNVGDWMGIREL